MESEALPPPASPTQQRIKHSPATANSATLTEMPSLPARPGRQPSIKITIPPSPIRTNLTLPTPPLSPSPHLRPRTQIDAATGSATIILPSVSTQEPEDELISGRRSSNGTHKEATALRKSRESSRRRSFATDSDTEHSTDRASSDGAVNWASWSQFIAEHSDDAEEVLSVAHTNTYEDADVADRQGGDEEEEVLEELADFTDLGSEDWNAAAQNNFSGLILATQAAALLALQTLLQEMQGSTKAALSSSSLSSTAAIEDSLSSQMAYQRLLDTLVTSVTEISTHDSMAPRERQEAFKRLNNLLDSLSSEALAVGSAGASGQGVTLANALGDLLQSLEKVRLPPDYASVEAARRQALPPVRARQKTPSTISSSPSLSKEELRDIFTESADSGVFATLHRLIASLALKCPVAPHHPRAPAAGHSPQLAPLSTFDAPSFGAPSRRFGSFDSAPVPHGAGPMSSTTSLQSVSTRSASSSASFFSAALTHTVPLRILSPADAEVWSHISHILGLTRDLVASRLAQRASPYGFYDGAASPLLTRSRRASASSASSDGICEARQSIERKPKSSLQYLNNARSTTSSCLSGSLVSSVHPTAFDLRDRAACPSSTGSTLLRKRNSDASIATISACGTSLSAPPSYLEHEGKRLSGATEAQIRDYQNRGILPAYGYDEKRTIKRASTGSHQTIPDRGILKNHIGDFKTRPQSPASRLSAGSSGATHEELHRLQRSIERVHRKAPQLIEQRAASPGSAERAFPRKSATAGADLNLQELIDRLAQSSKRLDDQRVAPPAPICNNSVAAVPTPRSTISNPPTRSSNLDRQKMPSKSGVSVFKKLGNVQFSTLRRFPGTSKVKERKRLSTPTGPAPEVAMKQVDLSLLTSSVKIRRRADARQTSSVPAFASCSQVPSAQSAAPASTGRRSVEDATLFELLASSSARSRLADQEAIMRPMLRSSSHIQNKAPQRVLACALGNADHSTPRTSGIMAPAATDAEGLEGFSEDADFCQGAEQRLAAAPIPPRHLPHAQRSSIGSSRPEQEKAALLA